MNCEQNNEVGLLSFLDNGVAASRNGVDVLNLLSKTTLDTPSSSVVLEKAHFISLNLIHFKTVNGQNRCTNISSDVGFTR